MPAYIIFFTQSKSAFSPYLIFSIFNIFPEAFPNFSFQMFSSYWFLNIYSFILLSVIFQFHVCDYRRTSKFVPSITKNTLFCDFPPLIP